MTAENLDIQFTTLVELDKVAPGLPQLKWFADKAASSSIEYSIQKFQIPANQSSDLTLTIQTISGTFISIIYNPDDLIRNTTATVSVKINGGQSVLVAPRIILSEDITSLTATNADATNTKELVVAKFYNNGTVTYKSN